MSAATFDTLTTARKLEAAGVERRQAEAHAEVLREAVVYRLESLVTKADLAAGIAGLENRMLKVAVGLVFANVALTVGLTVGLIKLL